MTIDMNDDSVVSVAQLSEFAKFAKHVKFNSNNKKQAYEWVGKTLGKFHYHSETKKNRGIIKNYIIGVTGYSSDNVDKLIARKKKYGKVFLKERTQHTFPRFYTKKDISLIAEIGNMYRGQNGYAMKKVFSDMYKLYDDFEFERLSYISVSHIYNLKQTEVFKAHCLTYTKTNPTSVNIGERRKPNPYGKPGFLRVDSVHQGDLDKEKGVYHIHFVDEITQEDVTVAVEKISEYFLEGALKKAFNQFHFKIINFHSDNGSEFINKVVAELLNKLMITQTKSRSRHCNDNALVESKNASTVRKHMGRAHIPQKYAPVINKFYENHLNPFVNFHKPCAFSSEIVDSKGKVKKVYKQSDYMTPVEKLLSLKDCEKYLRDGITKEKLKKQMFEKSHFEVAKETYEARDRLFREIKSQT
jgi:hypothetical protein